MRRAAAGERGGGRRADAAVADCPRVWGLDRREGLGEWKGAGAVGRRVETKKLGEGRGGGRGEGRGGGHEGVEGVEDAAEEREGVEDAAEWSEWIGEGGRTRGGRGRVRYRGPTTITFAFFLVVGYQFNP
jgi:hypothetical protein